MRIRLSNIVSKGKLTLDFAEYRFASTSLFTMEDSVQLLNGDIGSKLSTQVISPVQPMEVKNDTDMEKKQRVSFMTTMDRELFPVKMPRNRFGNEIVPLRGTPHTGPGCYENEDKTSFQYGIEHKLTSERGYTLGARTGPRFPKTVVFETPCPTEYQQNNSRLKEFMLDNKPFLVGADRFPIHKRDIVDVLPGPGTYEHEIPRNRKVQWHQAFGGAPVLLPEITVQSTINKNTEKLYSTKEERKYHRKLAYLKLYYE